MKTICTKCGSDEVYIVQNKVEKTPEVQTMDEMVNEMKKPMILHTNLLLGLARNVAIQ